MTRWGLFQLGMSLADSWPEMDACRAIHDRHPGTERDRRASATANPIPICVVIVAVSGMIWLSSVVPVRINWTGSAPVGLYATLGQAPIVKADLVVVCLQGTLAAQGRTRGYLAAGSCPNGTSPILKELVATAGDEVELRSDAVAVNGRVVNRSQRLSLDSLGRPLELFPLGRHVVLDGEVWVLGIRRKRSWDSRYFGPIPASSIVGVARPLLTMNLNSAP